MSTTTPLIPIARTFVARTFVEALDVHLLIQAPTTSGSAEYPEFGPPRILFVFFALWPEGQAVGRAVRSRDASAYSLDDADGRPQWLDDAEARAIFGEDYETLMEAIAEACEEVLAAHPVRADAA